MQGNIAMLIFFTRVISGRSFPFLVQHEEGSHMSEETVGMK
jgi:hypothetical protein